MNIIGDRSFVEIPGDKQHDLPPLLVHSSPQFKRLDKIVDMAASIVETEDLLPAQFAEDIVATQQRKMDLAIHLVEQYKRSFSTGSGETISLSGSGNVRSRSSRGPIFATCFVAMSGLTQAAPVSCGYSKTRVSQLRAFRSKRRWACG